MKLYRAVRQVGGRTDVYVSTYTGDAWLQHGSQPKGLKLTQYEWGSDSPGARKLARALLADALHNDEAAELLCDDFAAQVIFPQVFDRWALTDEEIRHWALDQLLCELAGIRGNQHGGSRWEPSDS